MKAYSQQSRGFTIIELMIAMLIGLILVLGIALIFVNTTNNVRVQRGLVTLQENARFAVSLMDGDLSNVGALYCTSTNSQLEREGGAYIPGRPLVSAASTTTAQSTGGLFYGLPGNQDTTFINGSATAITAPYRITPRVMLMGHECAGSTCTPGLTVMGAAIRTGGTSPVPAAAVSSGSRVPGSDVLTLRRLVGRGAPLASDMVVNPASPGGFTISLVAGTSSALGSGATGSRLLMVSDCDSLLIFRGSVSGDTVTATAAGNLGIAPYDGPEYTRTSNARVFDMENQFQTITYFLQYVDDPNQAGRLIPALMRWQNGTVEEMVRGVERLDFRYQTTIIDASTPAYRNNVWLTADQINSNSGGWPCPPRPIGINGDGTIPVTPLTTDTESGCLWRGVTAIEVGMLLNTVDDLGSVAKAETSTYTMAGQAPTAVGSTLPSGAPAGTMMRREVRFTVPLQATQP